MKTHLECNRKPELWCVCDMLAAALISGSRLFFHLGGRKGLTQTVNEFDKSSLYSPSHTYTFVHARTFRSHVTHRQEIQLRRIPNSNKKQACAKPDASLIYAWGKGGTLRHNRWVPRVARQHDLHVRKNQGDTFYILLQEGDRYKQIKLRAVSSEREHASVLQFLPFNLSVTSGGRLLIDKNSLFVKWVSASGQRRGTKTLTFLTRRISFRCHQLHVTVRGSNTYQKNCLTK